MRYRAGARKPQTRFFGGRSFLSARKSAASMTVRMPTTVAERATNGKVFSRSFSGTGARARFSRPYARTVTERRFYTGRAPPARGADGRAEGRRSWRRGGGNGGAGKVCIIFDYVKVERGESLRARPLPHGVVSFISRCT